MNKMETKYGDQKNPTSGHRKSRKSVCSFKRERLMKEVLKLEWRRKGVITR